tara:strand:+ start:1211 stop:2620 length:1410 start_codon:yes stop_codon:yes gene_type:complete
MIYPEQQLHLRELENGKVFDDVNLDCGQAYSVYKFHPEYGAFSACCDAKNVNYNHKLFVKLGKDYFDKHPDVVQTKKDLRNNIRNSRCNLCWQKEAQGIKSMRQTQGINDVPQNHQNPYLDVEKSYPTRIELWMKSTCNLGCFMCHLGNSNTLRKIWYKDSDMHGNDGAGYDNWIKEIEYNKKNMLNEFNIELEKWIVDKISDPRNATITIAYLGGEPTLHNEMFEHADKFIKAAQPFIDLDIERKISIVTNGTSKDALNVRFHNMFKKYAEAGWSVKIMVSQDGTDDAAQVRHGTNSEQVIKNYSNWMAPESVVNELTHFTVLSNLNFPYVHKLLYKVRDIIDKHYADNPDILSGDKLLSINFNPCMEPSWMQIRYLPKKFVVTATTESIKIFEYLNKNYPGINLNEDIFRSMLAITKESPAQQDVEEYFEKLHYVQQAYRKTYSDWDFYKNFPHLVEFASDYGIERK